MVVYILIYIFLNNKNPHELFRLIRCDVTPAYKTNTHSSNGRLMLWIIQFESYKVQQISQHFVTKLTYHPPRVIAGFEFGGGHDGHGRDCPTVRPSCHQILYVIHGHKWPAPIFFVAVLPSQRITISRSRKQRSLNYLYRQIFSMFHWIYMYGNFNHSRAFPVMFGSHIHQYHITAGKNACSLFFANKERSMAIDGYSCRSEFELR